MDSNEKAELQKKLDAEKEKYEELLTTHQDKRTEPQKETPEINKLKESNHSLQQSNKDLKHANSNLQHNISWYESSYKASIEDCHKLKARSQILQQTLETRQLKITELEQTCIEMQKIMKVERDTAVTRQSRITELEQTCMDMQKTMMNLKDEKDTALTRLSKLAGAKLSHNNAAIVDLSDPDRPTKLAKKLGEIYDNAWTDAFEELSPSTGDEVKTINVLLDTFKETYETAVCDVRLYENSVRRAVLSIPIDPNMSDGDTHQLCEEELYKDPQYQKTLNEMMILCSQACSESFSKKMYCKVKEKETSTMNAKVVLEDTSSKFGLYITECARICWLMRLRSPPLHLTFVTGENFDGNIFKQYTKSGSRIHYIVWPFLRLHENGPLLAKGVAQPY